MERFIIIPKKSYINLFLLFIQNQGITKKYKKKLFVWYRHLPVEVEKQVDRIDLYPNTEPGDQGGIDPGDQGWVPHLPVQEASRRSRYFPCIFLFHQVFLPNIFLIKKYHQLSDRCYHHY